MLAQELFGNLVKNSQPEEGSAMSREDQIIVRISMENGVPRVTPLTAKEQ
jgi:hypothetical protein